jgi:hypothetical protein
MMVIAMFMYPPLLTMPHAYSYIFELGIMLLIYVAFVLWGTKLSQEIIILRIGTLFGATAALFEIIHISIENFAHLNARAGTISTGLFMGALVLLFAFSGYCNILNQQNIIRGTLGALWSAVVCMLIVITYGQSMLFWAFDAIAKNDIGDPDFNRTGWTDFHAFVIADIFEACFKVLFVAPILAIIFGLIGGAVALIVLKIKKGKQIVT